MTKERRERDTFRAGQEKGRLVDPVPFIQPSVRPFYPLVPPLRCSEAANASMLARATAPAAKM